MDKNTMITITISGFKTKKQAIEWLNQYEGGLEQHFEEVPSCCNMDQYIPEMKEFKNDKTKQNFDLWLE